MCRQIMGLTVRISGDQEHALDLLGPEIGTSSIDWSQLSRFYLKTETESSLRNVMFLKINRTVFIDKYRTMDNVQKHNSCIRLSISVEFRRIYQTYCQYELFCRYLWYISDMLQVVVTYWYVSVTYIRYLFGIQVDISDML
jgi:hypothetical protein